MKGTLVGAAVLYGLANADPFLLNKLIRDLDVANMLGIAPEKLFSGQDAFNSEVASMTAASLTAETVYIPIDHKDPDSPTYENRFWVSDVDYQPGGPVFVFDCGEVSDCQDYANSYLVSETSFFKKLVKDFGGIGVAWEHRYYGQSLPFPVSLDTPSKDFQFLTNEQALADIPFFSKTFFRESFPEQDLSPDSTPWIIVGGSYPGMRAAFSRELYPDVFHAAFASSAPVQARVDMSVYFEQVYRGMNAYGNGNCTKDLHAAYKYIDAQLSDSSTSDAIKQLFLGKGSEKNSNEDFTSALSAPLGSWQASGSAGGPTGIGAFCDWLETDPTTHMTAPAEGFAPTKGNKAVAERFASWPPLLSIINSASNQNCGGQQAGTPVTCDLSGRTSDPASISWMWQYCSTWGYFQDKNFAGHEILSQFQTLQYQQDLCYRQFPDGISSGWLPGVPQTIKVDTETGGWTMRPSNVYFSGGQFDPWRPLSLLSTEDFAPKGVKFSQEIPDCGESTDRHTVFGYIMPNAQHCYDFYPTFKPGDVSRQLLHDAMEKWIPCFEPKNRK